MPMRNLPKPAKPNVTISVVCATRDFEDGEAARLSWLRGLDSFVLLSIYPSEHIAAPLLYVDRSKFAKDVKIRVKYANRAREVIFLNDDNTSEVQDDDNNDSRRTST